MHGRKGLLEWKVLAAIFAVLIVLSGSLFTSSGIKDVFFNTTTSIGETGSGSPLDGISDWFSSLFETPRKNTNHIVVRLYVDNMTLGLQNPVNITSGDNFIEGFSGDLTVDFRENTSVLNPAGSGMKIRSVLRNSLIEGVNIPSLALTGVNYQVITDNTDVTVTDGTLQIVDFRGVIIISDHIALEGNVTEVKDREWSMG